MTRLLSFSEVSMALDCMAKHDFAYGGHLAGTALKPKRIAPQLSGGRAWGAALAAYHSTDELANALLALDASLDDDADAQREAGVHMQEQHDELRTRLVAMLSHYVDTIEPLEVEPSVEHKLEVPIPSRTGIRASSKYRLDARIDAFQIVDGRIWLIEFKLRGQLMPVELIALSRQIRWYAWAWWQATGDPPAGVKVIERWNEIPKTPRMVQGRKKSDPDRIPSHAKDQLCTADDYQAVCAEHDVEPNPETVAELERRRWQQVVPIMFRPGELEEAAQELVSAAKLIGMLDSGEMMPLRNPKRANCSGCQFSEICPAPDNDLIDVLFERVEAKRNRPQEAAA